MDIPKSEWAVAVLGAVMVVGAIITMIVLGLVEPKGAADVSVTVRAVRPVSSGWLVQVEVINSGGGAIAEVTIEGRLKEGATVVERRQLIFDFLPVASRRQGALVFSRDPALYAVEVAMVSHREP